MDPGILIGCSAGLATSGGAQGVGKSATRAVVLSAAFDDAAARELRESIRNVATLSTELARTVKTQSGNLDRISGDVRAGVLSVRDASRALLDDTSTCRCFRTANGNGKLLTASLRGSTAG